VRAFARAWAAWIAERGGAAGVNPQAYLTAAEPFAAAFLESGCRMGDGGLARRQGAFQVGRARVARLLLCPFSPLWAVGFALFAASECSPAVD
jgi:hypothetical protein